MPTITDINGIKAGYADRLRMAGIRSVKNLLVRCGDKNERKRLAIVTQIQEPVLLKWTNMADFYRIKGIGREYSQLLELAGVDTVKELSRRNPQQLFEKIHAINNGSKLVSKMPSLEKVESFVSQAKKLPPAIFY